MRRFLALSLTIVAVTVSLAFFTSTVHAQATRTWVSGTGDDANVCSRTAPCKTFGATISKTAINGEINCLDPGGFDAITITRSVTIDCHDLFGAILNFNPGAQGGQIFGITIDFDAFDANSDVNKTVTLRNLSLEGA